MPEYARRIPPPSEDHSPQEELVNLEDEDTDEELERGEVSIFGRALSTPSEAPTTPPMVSLHSDDDGSELEVEPPS